MSIREAGQILAEHFAKEKEPQESHEEPHRIARTAEREAPPAGERADQVSHAKASIAITPEGEAPSCNEPLTFTLKNIDPDHPSVRALEIHEDTLTAFGVGYYRGRGMMGDRIVIPIYNPSRQLTAYAGFHPEEHTYTYPPKFRRELDLYNLGGALAADGEDQA